MILQCVHNLFTDGYLHRFMNGLFDRDAHYRHIIVGLVSFRMSFDEGNVLSNFHPFNAPPKHRVFVIKPRAWNDGNEEL